jgi:pimeloyl-ACP methyl ester carboxylesterase
MTLPTTPQLAPRTEAGVPADRFWTSSDGLKLHFRDYPGRADRPPVICLPGLTRNGRDFAMWPERLAANGGCFARTCAAAATAPMPRIRPLTIRCNMSRIWASCWRRKGSTRFVSFGTSLGGLMTMIVAMTGAERLAGVLLNDIGPVIAPEGLERIRGYVGQGRSFPTWMHAARALQEGQGAVFPDYRWPTGWPWPSAAWCWAATGGSCSITT